MLTLEKHHEHRSCAPSDAWLDTAAGTGGQLSSPPGLVTTAALLTGGATVLTAGPASADTTTSAQSFKVAAKARGTVLIAAATASPKVADPKPLNNAALITVRLG